MSEHPQKQDTCRRPDEECPQNEGHGPPCYDDCPDWLPIMPEIPNPLFAYGEVVWATIGNETWQVDDGKRMKSRVHIDRATIIGITMELTTPFYVNGPPSIGWGVRYRLDRGAAADIKGRFITVNQGACKTSHDDLVESLRDRCSEIHVCQPDLVEGCNYDR